MPYGLVARVAGPSSEATVPHRFVNIISQTSVSGIKWFVFMVLAGLIELTIAMIHVENRGTKVITMLIFATAVAVSTLLIMAYDRPFGGGVFVTPAALKDVLPR